MSQLSAMSVLRLSCFALCRLQVAFLHRVNCRASSLLGEVFRDMPPSFSSVYFYPLSPTGDILIEEAGEDVQRWESFSSPGWSR